MHISANRNLKYLRIRITDRKRRHVAKLAVICLFSRACSLNTVQPYPLSQLPRFDQSDGSILPLDRKCKGFKLMLVIIEYTGVRMRSSKCQSSKWFGYWSKRIKFRDYKILMPTLNNDWIRQMEIEIKVQHSRTTKIRKLKIGIKI